ncbi:MAG: hypothetical protein Q9N34_02790 [Aquificota bacterium]|nr:hypothetical protein [Aquificota bacterium]
MKHTHHGAETYGLYLGEEIVYVSCARYEERMLEVYPKGSKLMILNTTFYSKREATDHLRWEEAKELIPHCRPRRAVITHYSMEMHEKGPEKVARELSEELGLEVIPAGDGMELTLN